MRTFQINERISIECETKNTRNGFKHEATLFINGVPRDTAKVCYLNRTWESYTYQSVIHRLLENTSALTKWEKLRVRAKLDGSNGYDGEGCNRDMAPFKTLKAVCGVANIGLFGETKAQKNAAKKRMIDASLGPGIMWPDDWDTLSEDEKEQRLDKVIEAL